MKQKIIDIIIKVVAYLLYPLSIMYTVVVALRNRAFDCGLLKEQQHNVATIGVGNLSAGGTGKTPLMEYLANLFQNSYTVALLSRGYKRKTKGFVLATDTTTAHDIGDEPCQMHQKFQSITTAVCEKRNIGVQELLKTNRSIDLVLLDDVYQHRYIKPNILILLTEYANPYYADRVIPFGRLREPRSGYKRANFIVVTKCPSVLNLDERQKIITKIKPKSWQKIFFSYVDYGMPVNMWDGTTIDLNTVGSTLVVAGIANPKPLMEKVGEMSDASLCQFSDHHDFTLKDVELIKKQFSAIKADNKIILTTEKDYSRLKTSEYKSEISSLPIYYIPIKVKFHNNPTSDISFDKELTRMLDDIQQTKKSTTL